MAVTLYRQVGKGKARRYQKSQTRTWAARSADRAFFNVVYRGVIDNSHWLTGNRLIASSCTEDDLVLPASELCCERPSTHRSLT